MIRQTSVNPGLPVIIDNGPGDSFTSNDFLRSRVRCIALGYALSIWSTLLALGPYMYSLIFYAAH